MVAVDILKALGQKDPRNSWKSIKKMHPDIVEESSTFPFGRGGRSPEALGLEDPGRAWRRLKTQYPDLTEESSVYSFGRGRPPEVLGERGVYKLAMVAGGPKAALGLKDAGRSWRKLKTGYAE